MLAQQGVLAEIVSQQFVLPRKPVNNFNNNNNRFGRKKGGQKSASGGRRRKGRNKYSKKK